MSDFLNHLQLRAVFREEMLQKDEVIVISDDDDENENGGQSEVIEISDDENEDENSGGGESEVIVISDDEDQNGSGLAQILSASRPGWGFESPYHGTDNSHGFDYEPASWNMQDANRAEDDDDDATVIINDNFLTNDDDYTAEYFDASEFINVPIPISPPLNTNQMNQLMNEIIDADDLWGVFLDVNEDIGNDFRDDFGGNDNDGGNFGDNLEQSNNVTFDDAWTPFINAALEF